MLARLYVGDHLAQRRWQPGQLLACRNRLQQSLACRHPPPLANPERAIQGSSVASSKFPSGQTSSRLPACSPCPPRRRYLGSWPRASAEARRQSTPYPESPRLPARPAPPCAGRPPCRAGAWGTLRAEGPRSGHGSRSRPWHRPPRWLRCRRPRTICILCPPRPTLASHKDSIHNGTEGAPTPETGAPTASQQPCSCRSLFTSPPLPPPQPPLLPTMPSSAAQAA